MNLKANFLSYPHLFLMLLKALLLLTFFLVYVCCQTIDLNQPASPDAEDSPTAEMIKSIDQNKVLFNENYLPHQKVEDQLKSNSPINIRRRRGYQNLKKDPVKYKAHLEKKSKYKYDKFHKLDETEKNKIRLKRSKKQQKYIHRKREKDPTFKQFDERTALRKRVREGKGTKEDMEKYKKLKIKETTRLRESKKRKREEKETSSIQKKAKRSH